MTEPAISGGGRNVFPDTPAAPGTPDIPSIPAAAIPAAASGPILIVSGTLKEVKSCYKKAHCFKNSEMATIFTTS